jgi:hypothetical protein
MRDQLATEPRCTRQSHFARMPAADRPLTARELQLASDLELARGNRRRGELLSWRAHQARGEASA